MFYLIYMLPNFLSLPQNMTPRLSLTTQWYGSGFFQTIRKKERQYFSMDKTQLNVKLFWNNFTKDL